MKLIRDILWAQLSERQDGKLCTMFLFEGIADPQVLHVTHKYFGKDFSDVKAVTDILETYFKACPFFPMRVRFNRIAMLGDSNEVKVLLPENDDNAPFREGLKRRLDELVPDKYPRYLPHVSVNDNMDDCDIPLSDFALVKGGEVIWRASQMGGTMDQPTVSSKLRSIRTGDELAKRRKKTRKLNEISEDIRKTGDKPKQAIQTPKVESEGDDPKAYL